VVEEAATDIIAAAQARGIAEPWTHSSFIDSVAELQRQRLARASRQPDDVQFHDRSPVCTVALAAYLDHPISATLARELERIKIDKIYEPRVFFVRSLGFVTPSDARKISFEEAIRFERIHEKVYGTFGFELCPVEPRNFLDRVRLIKSALP